MPELPQELIDAIIEEVPASSLGSCALTATAFVQSSQRRIFLWKSLSTVASYERAAVILSSSPHLGAYVHYLALDIKEIPRDYTHLKTILAPLSEIQRLSITGNANAATRNQIAQNPCLVNLMSLPSLRCFALHHLSDVSPSLITRAFVSFEEVSLSHMSIADSDDEVSLSSLSIDAAEPLEADGSLAPPLLWHLSIANDAYERILPFVLHPDRVGAFSNLARLSLVFDPVTEALVPGFTRLLNVCSGTLEHLEIELEAPFALPALPALWFLELWIDVALMHHPSTLASIVSETAASLPHLEVLTLSIIDRPGQRPVEWAGPEPWFALDDVLMDMMSNASLCEVYFSLRYLIWEPARYATFPPLVESKLPRTAEEGILGFDYRTSFPHPMDRFATED